MKSGVFHPARPKPLVPEKNTQKKIALIEYLLEHIKEPVFTYTNSSLNDEFYIADEDDGLDIPKITEKTLQKAALAAAFVLYRYWIYKETCGINLRDHYLWNSFFTW